MWRKPPSSAAGITRSMSRWVIPYVPNPIAGIFAPLANTACISVLRQSRCDWRAHRLRYCLSVRSSAGEDDLLRFNALFDCLGSGRATTPRIFGAVEAHGDIQDHCIGRGNAPTRPSLQQGPYRGI